MKILPIKNSYNANFRGYDAVPLKAIYVEPIHTQAYEKELDNIGEKENIEVRRYFDGIWMQDEKYIVEKSAEDKSPYLLAREETSREFMDDLFFEHNIEGERIDWPTQGGNCFLGKKPNGEKWMLIGDNRKEVDKSQIEMAKKYFGVDEKNVFVLPQQDFHLDMYLRPIGYPYILVNDSDLVLKNIYKLYEKSEDFLQFRSDINDYIAEGVISEYCKCDETVKKLEEYGFKPIRIAGVYGWSVNFMNAIVNKHSDGKISYITNSSESCSPFYTSAQKMFLEDLKAAVPNLDSVYFVQGGCRAGAKKNTMMRQLEIYNGGIHCLSLEEPNFGIWG